VKRLIPLVLALVLSACAGMPVPATAPAAGAPAVPNSAAALAGMSELKMAFDVIDGSPGPLISKLATIDLTRKQLIEAGVTPRIVIAFRGEASYYTQMDLSKVGNGWISLAAYQARGYGYIAP
jgi:hypothetical protein